MADVAGRVPALVDVGDLLAGISGLRLDVLGVRLTVDRLKSFKGICPVGSELITGSPRQYI
jgi:hypothetical protein